MAAAWPAIAILAGSSEGVEGLVDVLVVVRPIATVRPGPREVGGATPEAFRDEGPAA